MKKVTRVKLMITPKQLEGSLFRDLRTVGYPLDQIHEVKVYPGGSIEVVCDMIEREESEEP